MAAITLTRGWKAVSVAMTWVAKRSEGDGRTEAVGAELTVITERGGGGVGLTPEWIAVSNCRCPLASLVLPISTLQYPFLSLVRLRPRSRSSVSGPHRGGQRPSPLATCVQSDTPIAAVG